MENQTVKDRIIFLITLFFDGKPKIFSDAMGISNTTVYGWIDEDKTSMPGGAHLITLREGFKEKLNKILSIDWLLTGDGQMMVEDRQPEKPHLTAAESQESYTTNSITEPDHNTRELLLAAQRVLKADHPSAPAALQSNIVCFDQAVADNKRLGIMEQRQEEIIKMLNTKTGTDPPLS